MGIYSTENKNDTKAWEDMVNQSRNGPVKIIPPPEGYKPPAPSKRKPFKKRINRYKA